MKEGGLEALVEGGGSVQGIGSGREREREREGRKEVRKEPQVCHPQLFRFPGSLALAAAGREGSFVTLSN